MKTIFFGSSKYVIPVIEILYKTYNLALVVTTESQPTDAVVAYCQQHTIPFVSTQKIDESLVEHLQKVNASFAVLADFRLMVGQDVLNIFPKGIINIHPSLLPEYRGPTPGTTALLEGKTTTGVSLMLLDNQLDHGPLIGQEKEEILPTDTSVTLYTRLFAKGAELLAKVLPEYLDGKIQPVAQDDNRATYSKYLTRESGFIDMTKVEHMSPLEIRNLKLEIARKVRAYFPWPGVWTLLRVKGKGLRVKFLPEQKIQVEGKNPVSYKDFLNGYPEGKELLEKLGI